MGLVPANATSYGKVYGVVKDEKGNPIKNATVTITTSDYKPLLHVLTDSYGTYLFDKVKTGKNYKIFATAQGMDMSKTSDFSIDKNESIKIDFTLVENPAFKLSIIAGDIFEKNTFKPIGGAIVSLFKKITRSSDNIELEAITYTNEYGQFVFREINIGSYIIKIKALGFEDFSTEVVADGKDKILSVKAELTKNISTSTGTVSGVIKNELNDAVEKADVILYRVDKSNIFFKTEETLTPIAFTQTNKSGVYLFMNVPKGEYKIKATEMEYIDVNNLKEEKPILPSKNIEDGIINI